MTLYIDFETRSRCPLRSAGAYNYAQHPSTEVLCLGYAIDDAPPGIWWPSEGPAPEDLRDKINSGELVVAHNAEFERLIWYYILDPQHGDINEILDTRWRCSAYMARCSNLPGGLDNLARLLTGGKHRKDSRGAALVRRMCTPSKEGDFEDTPELRAQMGSYCKTDVEVMRHCYKALRPLNKKELSEYRTHLKINDRGVKVDTILAEAAVWYADAERVALEGKIKSATGGAVVKARGEKLKTWVLDQLPDAKKELLKSGDKYSMDAYHRRLLLESDIPEAVRNVVTYSDMAQKSSVAKFAAMNLRADPVDLRVRGAYVINGASSSGRYSSRGLQVHNFARDGFETPEVVRQRVTAMTPAPELAARYGVTIMELLSRMLRHAIVPKAGHVFVVADWSAIEGRVAPWLALSKAGRAKLQLYADNQPVYEMTAASLFGVPLADVTSSMRLVGKVAELSLQFGGGEGALIGMGRNYGLVMSDADATRIKKRWRAVNPWGEVIWNKAHAAACQAVAEPGVLHTAGKLRYYSIADGFGGCPTLFLILPDNAIITYPGVESHKVKTDYGNLVDELSCWNTSAYPAAGETAWPRMTLWRGMLFNNAVQGTAARIHKHALHKLRNRPVVLHTHDEIVLEVPEAKAEKAARKLVTAMTKLKERWQTLPLAVDCKIMPTCYGK